jgi:omega-6 fatty acid desaturase (delta-12 desaturase)
VHHANCNSVELGETHVPKVIDDDYYKFGFRNKIGRTLFGIYMYAVHYLAGWPAYILLGKSGGPKYGNTNHFWPYAPFNDGEKELYPGKWKKKVLQSDVGILAFVGALAMWAKATSW